MDRDGSGFVEEKAQREHYEAVARPRWLKPTAAELALEADSDDERYGVPPVVTYDRDCNCCGRHYVGPGRLLCRRCHRDGNTNPGAVAFSREDKAAIERGMKRLGVPDSTKGILFGTRAQMHRRRRMIREAAMRRILAKVE